MRYKPIHSSRSRESKKPSTYFIFIYAYNSRFPKKFLKFITIGTNE